MSEKKNKHKRWNRAAKASQFTRGAGGEMVYIGRHYSYQGDERSYRQSMRLRMVLAAIMGVAQVAGGLMPIPALYNTWYVIAPYMLTFFAVVSLVWAVCRLSYWGNPLREYVYDATIKQLPIRTILAMILSMCTLCGQIVYVVTHSLQGVEYLYSFAFLGLEIVVFVCAVLWKGRENRALWSI